MNGSNANANLYEASAQWANRPADERFWTLEELAASVKARRAACRELSVPLGALEFHADGPELLISGANGGRALMTNYAFSRLAANFNAPSGFLSSLPPAHVAADLNYLIGQAGDDRKVARNLLFQVEDHAGDPRLRLRSYASERYGRIWDIELIDRLQSIRRAGWQVPPARPSQLNAPGARPATAADILRHSSTRSAIAIREGDLIAPAGLYAGDRDMFVFMVDESKVIEVAGEELCRGFFLWNSEVAGAASFGITTFLYRAVCGNHIVWGAQDVRTHSTRHIGDAKDRALPMLSTVAGLLEADTTADREMITGAIASELGPDREKVLIEAKKITGSPARTLDAAYTIAETVEHLNPRSRWGLAQGLTRIAGEEVNADSRSLLDRAAGKLLAGF